VTSSPTLAQCYGLPANNFNLIRLAAASAVIHGHVTAITGHGPPDLLLAQARVHRTSRAAAAQAPSRPSAGLSGPEQAR